MTRRPAGRPGITPRPATPPPALAGKLSDQHLLAQNIRSGVGVAWRLAASRRAHSALSAATSCCCHVEFRAGKRWCACQRGCALLPGSWAGEGIEYGGAVSSADPREYPCVCRSRALAGAVWPRPRRNGPGRRAWPWSQSLLIARASSMACSGLPGRAGLVILSHRPDGAQACRRAVGAGGIRWPRFTRRPGGEHLPGVFLGWSGPGNVESVEQCADSQIPSDEERDVNQPLPAECLLCPLVHPRIDGVLRRQSQRVGLG